MKIHANEKGLYEFDIIVSGCNKSKILKGLVDTGSTDCACNYKVITTLQIRPIDYTKISSVNNEDKHALIYSCDIEFDGKSETVPLARVSKLPDDIHFILGMSILEKCKIIINDNHMDISWK